MKYFFFSIALAILTTACTNTNTVTDAADSETRDYVLPGTQVFDMESSYTGNSYRIEVTLPGSYASAPADKKYPVVYVLDSQWQYPMMHVLSSAITWDGDMEESILVGVTWNLRDRELHTYRDQDFNPARDPAQIESGGAAKFQNFFRHELFPRIEGDYKGSQHRIITGGSMSSNFAVYTLLTAPDMFDAYIASSPGLKYQDSVLQPYIDAFSPELLTSPVRVQLSRGSYEYSYDVDVFAERLQKMNSDKLAVEFALVAGSGHAGVNAETYTRGLQFAYRRPDVDVAANVLQRYVGKYASADGKTNFSLALDRGRLVLVLGEDYRLDLNAENSTRFYTPGLGRVIALHGGGKLTFYDRRVPTELEKVSVE